MDKSGRVDIAQYQRSIDQVMQGSFDYFYDNDLFEGTLAFIGQWIRDAGIHRQSPKVTPTSAQTRFMVQTAFMVRRLRRTSRDDPGDYQRLKSSSRIESNETRTTGQGADELFDERNLVLSDYPEPTEHPPGSTPESGDNPKHSLGRPDHDYSSPSGKGVNLERTTKREPYKKEDNGDL